MEATQGMASCKTHEQIGNNRDDARDCCAHEEDKEDVMEAFFIAMPDLNFEDALRMGLSSIAETETMAWRKHIGIREGIEVSWDNREISRRIQAWFDKGYRVKRITISKGE